MPTHPVETPLAEIANIRNALSKAYATGKTQDIAFRKTQLLQLAYMFQDNRERLRDAISSDLGRHPNETDYFEYVSVANHAIKAYENVETWAKPETAPFSLTTFAMAPCTYKQPKGVVLIIGPYNYPVFCVANPLIGAIAAGCAVVIHPSTLAPNAAAFWTELIPKYLDPTLYAVVNGPTAVNGVYETPAVIDLPWDHLFFTGSAHDGRTVAAAAAKHLTPVTLELGGKNPTIVDDDCDFDATARRIMWGKQVNAGQTGTSPDYVIVVRKGHDKLVTALKKAYDQFFPTADVEADQTRLVNAAAFQRIVGLLEQTAGKIIIGGKRDSSKNWLGTTVVDMCTFDDVLMKEQLFGPVLPILTVESIEEAVSHLSKRDHPLGCYIFSRKQKVIDYVIRHTTSGGVVANDCVIQAGIFGIAFGGIGTSGYGSIGGKYGFDTFTQLRGSLQFPLWLEKIMSHRYPPYTRAKMAQIQSALVKPVPYRRPGAKSNVLWANLPVAITFVAAVSIYVGYTMRQKAKYKFCVQGRNEPPHRTKSV